MGSGGGLLLDTPMYRRWSWYDNVDIEIYMGEAEKACARNGYRPSSTYRYY